ncbi:MAG: hypothetical protein ABI910_09115 [Gemmatimonadota bacterium]
MRSSLVLVAALALATPHHAAAQLYRATMIQAAPGRLVELIDAVKGRLPAYAAAGEATPYLLRHSQGDHWDLFLLEPLGASLQAYFGAERVARRRDAGGGEGGELAWERRLQELSAWREDQIVSGPAPERLRLAMSGSGFAHLEMFVALAGKHDALLKERAMENVFATAIGRPENLIFTRVSGAAWDSFTIGNYRDMVHYATSAVVPAEREETAARAAGFASRADIGPYLRGLINSHHDNLLSVVR